MIKHTVLFKFNPDVSETERQQTFEKLKNLGSQISMIKEWQIGRQREVGERFYDMVQISSFETQEDMNSFIRHPKHIEIRDLIRKRCTYVKVDFEV